MSDQPAAPALPKFLDLPPAQPLGGTRWSRRYAAPRRARLTGITWRRVANAVVHPDGHVAEDDAALTEQDAAVLPLPAGGAVTIGQFLTGPVAAAYQAGLTLPFCGAPLSPRQTDILAKLGFLRGYIALAAPRRFTSVTAPEMSAGAPGPFTKPLAEFLRAPEAAAKIRAAILPRRETEKFCLTNRASLTAWLRAKQVAVIDPETTRLSDLQSLLASASLVILADPAQSGLLGLCAAGTKILEIAPEGWLGLDARVMSAHFGLDWQPFLAAPPSYPLQGPLPFGSLVPCSYDVPIRELAKVLEK
jgi:hypothetical protein